MAVDNIRGRLMAAASDIPGTPVPPLLAPDGPRLAQSS